MKFACFAATLLAAILQDQGARAVSLAEPAALASVDESADYAAQTWTDVDGTSLGEVYVDSSVAADNQAELLSQAQGAAEN